MLEKVDYTISGDGKQVVLFLHGWGGSKKNFEYVCDCLKNDFKVINLSFVDFGESEAAFKPLDVYEHAFIIFKLLKELNINSVSIVGHSFGGRIAIILSSLFNINIEKIVLVDAAGLKPRFNLKTYLKIKIYKFLKRINKTKKLNMGSDDYKNLNDNMKISFVKIVNEHLDYLCEYIKQPTLIVWGTKDKTTPIYMAKRLNKTIENSGVVFFKNKSHFCYLEDAKKFVIVLNSFLNS